MTSERSEEGQIADDKWKEKGFGRDRAVSAAEMEAGVPSGWGGRKHQWMALLLGEEYRAFSLLPPIKNL